MNKLNSLLGRSDFVPVGDAVKLLGSALSHIFDCSERLPLFGEFLRVGYRMDVTSPGSVDEVIVKTLASLENLEESATEEDVLSLFMNWQKNWQVRSKLDSEMLINLKNSKHCWVAKELYSPIQPNVRTGWIEILFQSKLFVQDTDLRAVLDTSNPPINSKARKVAFLEEKINDLQTIISVLWKFRDQESMKNKKDLQEYILGSVGVERGDTSLERLIREAINKDQTDK